MFRSVKFGEVLQKIIQDNTKNGKNDILSRLIWNWQYIAGDFANTVQPVSYSARFNILYLKNLSNKSETYLYYEVSSLLASINRFLDFESVSSIKFVKQR